MSTKLAPPRPQPSLVVREALLARLDAGLDRKLTLLSAPAGFGKTTLVSQWLASVERRAQSVEREAHNIEQERSPPREHVGAAALYALRSNALRFAWVALDAGDNDPVRFWRYVITACQAFDPAIGAASLPLLQTAQQPPWEAVLTTLINELAQLETRCVLVLEDYHVITAHQIHETVAGLLDYLPATLHLMLITRSDPPLPLARLRARNDLSELGAADLRFSPAETRIFLQQALPFPLASEASARLAARTEGWAAGLRLVALALQGRQDPQEIEQALATFSGSDRQIVAYLVEDVLGAQPEPIQAFLLRTSVLNRLTGSLCDAVTGRNDSATILDELERANLFITPLDDRHGWYRYHALFAEALRHEARRRLGEDGLRALYDRASRWYERYGSLADAVEAALVAQAWARAAELIERSIAPQLVKNEYYTLRRWLELLPKEALCTHPSLCFGYATAILFTSDRRAPTTLALLQEPLDLAEQGWRAAGNRDQLGAVLAFRAMVAWWQGDLTRSFAAARQALDLLPEQETQWRGISLIFAGVEELAAGKLDAARQTLIEARTLSEAAGNSYGSLSAIIILGEVYARRGELRQAAQLCRQVLTAAEDVRYDREQVLFDRGRALIGLAALAYEWNDLAVAEQEATAALEIGGQLADEELLVPASLILARVAHARGATAQAQQRLHALVAQITRPLLLRQIHAEQAWLALAAGDMATAQRWYAADAQDTEELPGTQREREALIAARMLIAQGEAGAARSLLERWQADARAQGRARSELEMLVLTALAHAAENDMPQAWQTLMAALTLAQPEGYQRLFLDEGERMAELLAQSAERRAQSDPLRGYIAQLLAAIDVRRVERSTQNDDQSVLRSTLEGSTALTEPLSPQEQRVLRLLAAGLSNPEIAQELVVSVNTVKTQVSSIYRKLNVTSRAEARKTARQLNLT